MINISYGEPGLSGEYEKAFRYSIEHAGAFWREAAGDVRWDRGFDRVLDDSRAPFHRWFTGGEINMCYNALDRHVEEGFGARTALIYDSPVTGTVRKYTYTELLGMVEKFAGVLLASGVSKGDRVIIYMPMIPEAAVAMLACARIGAVHSVVFGGFAARELAGRIDDARPKVIVSASCGVEGSRIIEYKPLLDRAIGMASHQPERCIICQREQARAGMVPGRDYDWQELMASARPAGCARLQATDPLYILYTSGTTSLPKGIVRDIGGYAVALKWSMKNIYGMEPGDVWWAASDIGWVVGHSYIIYGPLLQGCASVMYEGKPVGTPDPGAYWRVISQHGVKALFTAPTAVRAIRKEDPEGAYPGDYDLSGFRHLFLAGERTDTDIYYWARDLLGVPVIDHWWQTETGWAITGICTGIEELPARAGSAGRMMPGYKIDILDSGGNILPPEEEGLIAIRLPLPPGTMTTLWQNEARYHESYLDDFPGYYFTGDGGYIDRDGYVYVMGRIDDVINVAGHRLATGAMEEIIAGHPDVAEGAVIGIPDALKGQLPLGFVVLRAGAAGDEDAIAAQLALMVKEQIGAFANFKRVVFIEQMPKTRSGKILRAVLRKIACGESYEIPPTLDQPDVLAAIEEDAARAGLGRARSGV
jgi:propionyl-CoA synthetase